MSRTREKFDRAAWTILISIIFTVIIVAAQFPSNSLIHTINYRLDLLLYDIRFNFSLQHREPQQSSHKVIIVDIDENSLKEVGHWPWDRKTIADMTQQLIDAGVAVIAFDVVFSEPSTNIATTLGAALAENNPTTAAQVNQLEDAFDYDRILAQTFSEYDIILGYILHEGNNITSSTLPSSNLVLDTANPRDTHIDEMTGYTANIPILQQNVLAEGFINGKPDIDGIFRRAPLVFQYKNRLQASLALQTAMAYNLTDEAFIETAASEGIHYVQTIRLDNQVLPTDISGHIIVPYRGPRGSYRYFSAADVLNGNVDPSELEGAIAIVGTTAIGLFDLRSTPVGIEYPGVEAQATIIDTLLTGDIPYEPDWATGFNIIAILALFLFLNIVFPLCGPITMTLTGLGSITLLLGFNFWLWHTQNINLPLSGPLAEVILIYGAYMTYGFFFASQQKDQIHSMFGQYVAPAHIDKLINTPDALTFDGETKQMTVLFCDIRSFTSISEDLTANQLKDFLNRYFTPMTEIIFSQQGTIDKYVGDMIMAFWGAPLDDDEQQQHAINSALLMLEKTEAMKETFRELGYPAANIGIGINTGMMNVGDMGSTYRRAYTVLGDAVNLGSRLESITKFYGSKLLVSESTLSGIEQAYVCREVDYIQVKGRAEPVRVFEPLCLRDQADEQLLSQVEKYHSARKAYLAQNWSEAKEFFNELVVADSSAEKLYWIYINRINDFEITPPAEDWQGVWKHDSK